MPTAAPETAEALPDEPAEGVQITKKWVTKGGRGKRNKDRHVKRSSLGGTLKGILDRVGDAAYIGVVEQIKNADPQDQRSPVFVLNHDILPVSELHLKGLEAFKADVAQQYGDGSYAIRFLYGSNFSYRLKDPETGEAFPDVPFLIGKIKLGVPEGEEDEEDDPEDPVNDEMRDASKELRLARMEKRLRKLRGEDGGGGGGKMADLAALVTALKPPPQPQLDVPGLFTGLMTTFMTMMSAQEEQRARADRRRMEEFSRFQMDLLRQQMELPRQDDLMEDAPWFVKVGARVLERVADTPAGQVLAAKIGAPAATAPASAAPPPVPQLPPPPKEAQARAAALSRFFLFLQQAGDLRPDPGVFVDKYLRTAFGMCAEPDRVEVLGFLRQLRGGDYSGVEHLLQFFQSHRVPVRDFVLKVQAQPLLLHWTRDVLLNLLDTHEPPPAEEAPEAGTEAPKVNGTGEEVGPMGTGAEQEAEAPAATEEEPHA